MIQLIYNGNLPIIAELSDTILFPHGLNGIFISGGAKIGKNVVIFQHVTIGSKVFGNNAWQGPIIENNVVIGAGAKIIGSVRIGQNSKIWPGSIIFEDVPANSIAKPPKPVIIKPK